MEPDAPQADESDEEAAIQAAIRRGQEAIANGDVITHEEVKRRFYIRFTNTANPDDQQ